MGDDTRETPASLPGDLTTDGRDSVMANPLTAAEAHRRARRSFTDGWWRRMWIPAARDSLRRRRRMVGSRWWFLRVLPHRALACRSPQMSSYGWRCQRLWLHGGAHRFRNYVWSDKWADERQVHYDPLPNHGHSVVTW